MICAGQQAVSAIEVNQGPEVDSIRLRHDDKCLSGTAAPKCNQAGGGVEELFSADLPAGTPSGPQSIAER